jgi:DNA-binding MarR family transcriptional regulator
MSQVKLLLLVARPGQQFKVTDVAEFLGVTNAAASRAIDRLVQRDLVDRSVSPRDRRAVTLSLTPDGEELLNRFQRVRNRELLELLGPVDTDRLRLAAEILDELSVKLLALDQGGEERCLRCGIHFRRGCVVRDVLGRECAVAGGLYGSDDQGGGGPA